MGAPKIRRPIHLRDPRQVQKAHDLLHYLGTPEAPGIFSDSDSAAIHAAHDTLAWVLGFPCGAAFQANLDDIGAELERLGIREIDAGEVLTPEEAKERGLA